MFYRFQIHLTVGIQTKIRLLLTRFIAARGVESRTKLLVFNKQPLLVTVKRTEVAILRIHGFGSNSLTLIVGVLLFVTSVAWLMSFGHPEWCAPARCKVYPEFLSKGRVRE